MSQMQVANITFSAAGSTRIETDSTSNVIMVTVNSANVMYANPSRTVFPTGTINVDNEVAIGGAARIGGSLFVAGANVIALIEAAGGDPAASQAEQEAGTEAAKYVAPATQHFHPSAAKFWVKATGAASTIEVSYNMTSWTDGATGTASGTIADDFSSADWCATISFFTNAGATIDATFTTSVAITAQAAGTFSVVCGRMQDGATAAASLVDPAAWFVAGYGDQ